MSSTIRRSRRSLATLTAGALATAGLLPFAAAPAAAAPAQDIDAVCPTDLEGGFDDAGEIAAFEDAIQCLGPDGYSLFVGDGAGEFNPAGTFTRGQLSTVTVKFMTSSGYDVPSVDSVGDAFPDDNGNVHEDAINILSSMGIVGGFSNGQFGPNAPVTRGQYAKITVGVHEEIVDAYNAENGTSLALPAPEADAFPDDDGSVFEPFLNQASALGTYIGNSAGNADPDAGLQRGAAALILSRGAAAQLSVSAGLWPSNLGTGTGPEAPAGDTNVFSIDPTTDIVIDLDEADFDDDENERRYTASGLEPGEEYKIALAEYTDVENLDDGIEFTDQGDSDEYDFPNTDAYIGVVNGSSVSGNQSNVEEDADDDGEISFTVESEDYAHVIPVVWLDDEDDGNLELVGGENNSPAEDFGLGGGILFLPEEAAAGTSPNGTVAYVDLDEGFFIIEGTEGYFEFDNSDDLEYGGTDVGDDDFEDAISRDDVIDGDVYSLAVGGNRYDITNDQGFEPGPVEVVEFGDIDDDDDETDVRFEWSTPLEGREGALVDEYQIGLAVDDSDDDEPACSEFTALAGNPFGDASGRTDYDGDFEADFFDLDDDTYCVHIRILSENGDEGPWNQFVQFEVGDSDNASAPIIVNTQVDNGGAAGTLDSGDIVFIDFDEDMISTLGSTNDTFVRFDDGNTVGEVACVDEADCYLVNRDDSNDEDDEDDRLVMVLTADPVIISDDTDVATGTVTTGSGTEISSVSDEEGTFEDRNGNDTVDLEASEDISLNAEDEDDLGPYTSEALFTTGGADGDWKEIGDVLTLQMSEPVTGIPAGPITEAAFEELTGAQVDFTGATVTAAVDAGNATQYTFTISVAELPTGINENAQLNGTDNATIQSVGGEVRNQIELQEDDVEADAA